VITSSGLQVRSSQPSARISSIAFPLLTLSLTQSALQVGIVSALGNADDYRGRLRSAHRPVGSEESCDPVGRGWGVNLVSIPVALAFGQLTVWQLYATALLDGLMSVLFHRASGLDEAHRARGAARSGGAVRSVCCLQSGRHRSTPRRSLYGIGNAILSRRCDLILGLGCVPAVRRSEFQLERQGARGIF
jgi:hypothetical protein